MSRVSESYRTEGETEDEFVSHTRQRQPKSAEFRFSCPFVNVCPIGASTQPNKNKNWKVTTIWLFLCVFVGGIDIGVTLFHLPFSPYSVEFIWQNSKRQCVYCVMYIYCNVSHIEPKRLYFILRIFTSRLESRENNCWMSNEQRIEWGKIRKIH